MPTPLPISGIVITRNEGDRIGRCLQSLQPLCAELLVLDSGSDDDTVEVAQSLGARVEHQDWLGFAGQKNAAIARARQPWVLMLDADEWLAEGADADLRALFASGRIDAADVWLLPRRNRFLGSWLRHREMTTRLTRPDLRYLPMRVHERMDLAGRRVLPCDVVIEHDTARSYAEHERKQGRYARLWAEQKHAEGRRGSPLAPWTHAIAYLLKVYLLRGGLLEGRSGWLYHWSHARCVVEKYRLLRALAKQSG